MTATIEKKPFLPTRRSNRAESPAAAAKPAPTSKAAVALGKTPSVDLLPPEVKQAQRTRGLIQLMIVVAAIVVAAVIAAVLFANVVAATAMASLEAERARTAVLLASQGEFAEGRQVAEQITELTAARAYGASTEIEWKGFLDPIRAALPEGGFIESATATAPAPWEESLAPADALRSERVATLSMSIVTPTQLGATDWVRTLEAVPGYADSTTDKVSFDMEDGLYTTEVTLNVNADARSNRFAVVVPGEE